MDTAAIAHNEGADEEGITCPTHTTTLPLHNPGRYCYSAKTAPLHTQILTRWGDASVGDTATTPPVPAQGLGIPASLGPPPSRAGPLISIHPREDYSDRSPAAISRLENELKVHQFPFLGDAESTWNNAVSMIIAKVGDGFCLKRRDKSKIHRNAEIAKASLEENRWSIVHIVCEQGGLPTVKPRVVASDLRRRSSSKKVDCSFKVVLNWPRRQYGPCFSEASICLKHCTNDSGDGEYERPQLFQFELTTEEIQGQVELIRRLHKSGAETKDIHKALQTSGIRLGKIGKQIVRNIRWKMDNFQASTTAYDSSGYNDAQLFVRNLQQDSCFLRFKMDTEGCITCIAWAHHAQQLNAMRYHSIIIQNTFNTSMNKYQLALAVVVDKENHIQLAM